MLATRCTLQSYGALWTLLVGLVIAAPVSAELTVLHSFDGANGDGYYPLGGLIQSGDVLYGTTNVGGLRDTGTIFQIRTDGSDFRLLHSFEDGTVTADGYWPWYGSLIRSGTTLYGTTTAGGSFTSGDGAIFRINTDGTGYGLVHAFEYPFDGAAPYGSLVQVGSTLYGMTLTSVNPNAGKVFKVETDGTGYQILHSFTGGAGGSFPHGGLIHSGTTLYGTTTGNHEGFIDSRGTIFRIEIDGTGFEVLHTFDLFSNDEGAGPYGNLVQSGSTLYGTTSGGGSEGGGTIFRINTDGSDFDVLRTFNPTDGMNPVGTLLLSGTMLYGMTTNLDGASATPGSLFQIRTDGTGFRVLHRFTGPDGGYPHGSLIRSGSKLYGMTTVGGDFGHGVVFSFDIPEPAAASLMAIALLPLLRRRPGLAR